MRGPSQIPLTDLVFTPTALFTQGKPAKWSEMCSFCINTGKNVCLCMLVSLAARRHRLDLD